MAVTVCPTGTLVAGVKVKVALPEVSVLMLSFWPMRAIFLQTGHLLAFVSLWVPYHQILRGGSQNATSSL